MSLQAELIEETPVSVEHIHRTDEDGVVNYWLVKYSDGHSNKIFDEHEAQIMAQRISVHFR